MKDKIQAIYAAWNASTIGCPLYHAQAPEGQAMPYTVFLIVSDVSQVETSHGQAYSRMLIQFSTFGTSDTQVLSIMDAIDSIFDLSQPSIPSTTPYNAISMQSKSKKLIKEDRLIWHGVGEYLLLS